MKYLLTSLCSQVSRWRKNISLKHWRRVNIKFIEDMTLTGIEIVSTTETTLLLLGIKI